VKTKLEILKEIQEHYYLEQFDNSYDAHEMAVEVLSWVLGYSEELTSKEIQKLIKEEE
tara:strand:+ start:1106 stop:1279 length:174 start_codon:yes stop_codon:yes gene_type:complete